MPTVAIPIPPVFDFHLTAGHQTYYRGTAGADVYVDGTYHRALRRGDRVLVASARLADDGGAVEVSLADGVPEEDLRFAGAAVARMLGMDVDLAGFYEMLARDSELSGAVGSLHGLRPPRNESPFEALVMAITAQQISGNVARVIRDAMVSTYGTAVEAAGRTLYAFPTPQALLGAGPDNLRALKLSARKAEYILDIAQHALNGLLEADRFDTMDDEAAIGELSRIRGVGRWTAEQVLLRALGRTDILPAGDLALRRVVSTLYFDGAPITEPQLAAFAEERWRPYRGLATTYLFAYLRQQRLAQEAARTAAKASAAPYAEPAF